MKKIFISYAHKDEEYKNKLVSHLTPLIRAGEISIWQDRDILVGDNWESNILENLTTSDMVIFLISPNFLASDYCYDIEVKTAVELHNNNLLKLVPVLIKSCDFSSTLFGKIQGLPKDMKPIDKWDNEDEAFMNVINGLKSLLAIKKSETNSSPETNSTTRNSIVINNTYNK